MTDPDRARSQRLRPMPRPGWCRWRATRPRITAYPHELWTTRLLARHAREYGAAAGHGCLANLVQGTVCKILGQEEIKPHKVRYYLERRDAEFEQKMAEVLCVYREVQVLKKAAAKAKKKSKKPRKSVAIVSYDEKPGIQAIATTSPDLPPVPGTYATFSRDHEYKRHGTLSLLAGIDLLTGKVHAPGQRPPPQSRVHRIPQASQYRLPGRHGYQGDPGQPFGAYLQRNPNLARYSAGGPLRVHLHVQARLLAQPHRGLLLQVRRSVLRHIRVASKQELKERIMLGIMDVNRYPVIHTWSYKLAEAA
jgi:hypothetical protein